MISTSHAIGIVAAMAIVTVISRALPFILFDRGGKVPGWVSYLGGVLPPAIMSFLLVYCVRGADWSGTWHGLPEIIGIVVTIALHFWKRNTFLSIGVGTVLYMVLVQVVFV